MLPEDCPSLYDELTAYVRARPALNAALGATLSALDPDQKFPNGVRISKQKCHEYGLELVSVLQQICSVDRACADEVRAFPAPPCPLLLLGLRVLW